MTERAGAEAPPDGPDRSDDDEERRLLRSAAMRMSAAVRRVRGAAALRESEDRYRALFNGIDEGFCIIEMRIEPGVPLDYLFVEVNEAFEKQSTLVGAKGRWMRELRPAHEEHWFEIYRDVALTGRANRFEGTGHELENRRFDVYAFRIGAPHLRRIGVLFKDVTEHRQLEHALRRAGDELESRVRERTLALARAHAALEQELQERRAAEGRIKALFAQLLTVQEDERRRIACAIHDQLAQQMTALRMNLAALERHAPRDTALVEQVQRVEAVAEDLDQRIDGLTWELHPAALDHLGLAAALRSLVQGWSRRSGIAAEFHGTGVEGLRLAPDVESRVYRLAQEALSNVHQHAGASRVGVVLERRGGCVVLVVEDDGRGFDSEALGASDLPLGLGLAGMRERAALIGGEFEIESAPGAGTMIYVRVPYIRDSDPRSLQG